MLRHYIRTFAVIFVVFISICTVVSCNDSDHTQATRPVATADSAVLRVAILPVEECSPLVYAQDSGLAKRMGLDLMLVQYDAMMDMDTAVLAGVAHVYFEDSTRIANMQADSLRPHILFPTPAKLSLVVNKNIQMDSVASLTTHMVGLTRHSVLETWMNRLADQAGCELDMIYHAQINSIPLRFNMLSGGLIDAAIVLRPWSDSLASMGHNVLKEEVLDGMGFYISASADSICRQKAHLLKKVYVEALSKMNNEK